MTVQFTQSHPRFWSFTLVKLIKIIEILFFFFPWSIFLIKYLIGLIDKIFQCSSFRPKVCENFFYIDIADIVLVLSLLYFLWLLLKPGSGPWTWTLDPDPEKPGPEKRGINIGLKNMSDYRELCFTKTIRNVSYCLKVRVLTDI